MQIGKASASGAAGAKREFPFRRCPQAIPTNGKTTAHSTSRLWFSTKEKAMGNAFGKNVMQARINALTMRSADSRALKTAKHIEENGLQENRSMRRHAKKEQQRMARSK